MLAEATANAQHENGEIKIEAGTAAAAAAVEDWIMARKPLDPCHSEAS